MHVCRHIDIYPYIDIYIYACIRIYMYTHIGYGCLFSKTFASYQERSSLVASMPANTFHDQQQATEDAQLSTGQGQVKSMQTMIATQMTRLHTINEGNGQAATPANWQGQYMI